MHKNILVASRYITLPPLPPKKFLTPNLSYFWIYCLSLAKPKMHHRAQRNRAHQSRVYPFSQHPQVPLSETSSPPTLSGRAPPTKLAAVDQAASPGLEPARPTGHRK